MIFSYFDKVKLSVYSSKVINLQELIGTIKNDNVLKNKIDLLRRKYVEEGKDVYSLSKKELPSFTPSGIFKKRTKESGLRSYTRLTVVDIDDLGKQNISLESLKTKVASIPESYLGFESPSGNGYKILVKLDSDSDFHSVATKQVINYYQNKLSIKIDNTGIDITRLCYLSYDNELYFNPNSEVFKVRKNNKMDDRIKKALDFIKNTPFQEGSRNSFIYLLGCNLNRFGVSESSALTFSISQYTENGFSETEIESTIKSAYKNKKEFGLWEKQTNIKNKSLDKSEQLALEIDMGLNGVHFQHRDAANILINEYEEESPMLSQLIQESFKEILKDIDYSPVKFIVEQFCKKPELDLEGILQHKYPKVRMHSKKICKEENIINGYNSNAIQILIIRYKIRILKMVFNKKMLSMINANKKSYILLLRESRKLEKLNNQWINDIRNLFFFYSKNRL